jgi:ribosomal protein S18 acetylase RimI-like enzyme
MIASPVTSRRLACRKLALLKQVGLFGADTKGAIIRRAYTARDLQQAYRLVHDVFLDTGYMKPEPSGIRLRMYETLSETATFIAEKNGTVVGVLSVVGDSPELGLPSDAAFKPELDAMRRSSARLCELTNQAVAEDYRKSAVATELMRCAIAHGMTAGYDESVATVSPGHNGFYEMVGFRGLGSQRSYSKKLHDPVVALTMDLDRYRRPVDGLGETGSFLNHFGRDDNPFLAHVAGWTQQARSHFRTAELLQELFVKERNFLAECSPDELEILEQRWGEETFFAVATASASLLDPELPAEPNSPLEYSTGQTYSACEVESDFVLEAAFA